MVLQKKKIIKITKRKGQHGSAVPYTNESTSISSGGEVSDVFKEQFGNILDEFLTYCTEHNPVAAYNLLSSDCKNLMYQSEEIFESSYYREKFEGNKSYDFQSWSTNDEKYVYLVRIFDNPLATGVGSNSKYVEEYITIVPEEDLFKININNYIYREDIYKEASNDLITAKVTVVDNYMEEKVYSINLKNNTEDTIILDTRQNPNSTYLVDENGNNIYALLYENNETDLILEPKEAKTIQIKFNATYRNGLEMERLEFTNIEKEIGESSMLSIEL